MTTTAAKPSSAVRDSPPDRGPFGERCPLPGSVAAGNTSLLARSASGNVAYHIYSALHGQTAQQVRVTVRVAKDDSDPPDPAAFAVAASRAASSSDASVVSAHTAEEIICVVCVAAPDRPAAVAVALAVVADALRAEDLVPSPSR